jgi:hypothetical protein
VTISRAALEQLDLRATDGSEVSLVWDPSGNGLIVAVLDEQQRGRDSLVGSCGGGLSTSELKAHLRVLESERRLALASPLVNDPRYMADLDDELNATRTTVTAAAVIEIARLDASSQNAPQG